MKQIGPIIDQLYKDWCSKAFISVSHDYFLLIANENTTFWSRNLNETSWKTCLAQKKTDMQASLECVFKFIEYDYR